MTKWDEMAKNDPPRDEQFRRMVACQPKPMLGLAEDRLEPGVRYSPKVRLKNAAAVRRHRQP